MEDKEFEIVEHIGVIKVYDYGWNKELNRVSWHGSDAKFDIRDWTADHSKASRGITLSTEEAKTLSDLLGTVKF